MSYKADAREFLERAGIDPDIFDWDIPEIMADFARVKVGEIPPQADCPECGSPASLHNKGCFRGGQ